jgi:ketosteroid isomerase-like protein
MKGNAIAANHATPGENRLNRKRFAGVASLIFALIFAFGATWQMQAQDNKTPYTSMAPIEQYLMDRDAEIALARSAAPAGVSRDAEVMVLGRHGYETAVKGKNGFVCLVDRSWMLPYDDPEFWNPKVWLPSCLNLPAARFHLPLTFHHVKLAFSGRSKTQISDATKTAFDKNELPLPESGSMVYMMSKQQNFGPKAGNANPHLMFWYPQKDHVNWGADSPDSPVDVHQYSPEPITEFSTSVSKWSDGTAYTDAAEAKPDKDKDLLFQLEAKVAADVAKDGHAGFFPHWAEDYVELVNGGGIVSGEDMRKQPPWPQGSLLTWTPIHAEMAASGDIGYVYGTWMFTAKGKDGKTEVEYGKYTTIWKKQKDGQWKIAASMGNSNPAPKTEK